MKLFGKAAIFGTSGSLLFGGQVIGSQDYVSQTQTIAKPFMKQELMSGTNEVIGYAVTRESKAISFDIIPVGGTSTNNTVARALAALDIIPSSVVTMSLSGCSVPSYDGTYLYVGDASSRLTNDGYAVLSLPVIQYQAAGSTPAVLGLRVSDDGGGA